MFGKNQQAEVARLIRAGLGTPRVIEDNTIWGAGSGDDAIYANIIGLALIGKIGTQAAIPLFDQALCEALSNDPDGEATQKILAELGIKDCAVTEELVVLHNQMPARKVASMLENGKVVV